MLSCPTATVVFQWSMLLFSGPGLITLGALHAPWESPTSPEVSGFAEMITASFWLVVPPVRNRLSSQTMYTWSEFGSTATWGRPPARWSMTPLLSYGVM